MSPLCLPCPPSTLSELEYGYTRDGRRPRHKLDPWGVWENAAAALATYNTWSHLTKRKTHVYLGQNKTTFILNLLSLVVKLDKGQDSVFWFFFFKKNVQQTKRKRFLIGRWKSAESECSPITGSPKQFLDLCHWVTRVTQSSLGAILLLTVFKCNRVWCHRPLLIFVKAVENFIELKWLCLFGQSFLRGKWKNWELHESSKETSFK